MAYFRTFVLSRTLSVLSAASLTYTGTSLADEVLTRDTMIMAKLLTRDGKGITVGAPNSEFRTLTMTFSPFTPQVDGSVKTLVIAKGLGVEKKTPLVFYKGENGKTEFKLKPEGRHEEVVYAVTAEGDNRIVWRQKLAKPYRTMDSEANKKTLSKKEEAMEEREKNTWRIDMTRTTIALDEKGRTTYHILGVGYEVSRNYVISNCRPFDKDDPQAKLYEKESGEEIAFLPQSLSHLEAVESLIDPMEVQIEWEQIDAP